MQTSYLFILDTETPVKQRVRQLLEYLGISQIELSRQIDVDQSNISIAGSERRPTISKELVKKITNRHTQIDPWWLLTGEGDMLREKKYPDVVGEPTVEYVAGSESWLDGFKAQLEDYERRIARLEADAKDKDDRIRDLLNDVRLLLKKEGRTKIGDGEES